MSLSHSELALWILDFFLKAGLLFALYRWRLSKTPLFTYLSFSTARTLVSFAVISHYEAYFYLYWTCEILNYALQCWLLCSYLQIKGKCCWFSGAFLAIAFFLAFPLSLGSPSPFPDSAVTFLVSFERFFALFRGCAIAAVLLLDAAAGISPLLRAEVSGWTIYALVALIVKELQMVHGWSGFATGNQIKQLAWITALFAWWISFYMISRIHPTLQQIAQLELLTPRSNNV